MVRARRNDDRIPVAHQALLLLVEYEACLALLDAEELIDFGCTSSPISSPGCNDITTSWACLPVNNTCRKYAFLTVCSSIGPV